MRASSIGKSLDSTSPNYGPGVKETLAEGLKITGDFDFRIYKESNDEYRIYLCDSLADYSSEDIQAIKTGNLTATVAATGYIYKENGDGIYSLTETGTTQDIPLDVKTEKSDETHQEVDFLVLIAAKYNWNWN